jgi:hypothetical protein
MPQDPYEGNIEHESFRKSAEDIILGLRVVIQSSDVECLRP